MKCLSDGTFPNASSYDAAISGDGPYVAFVSDATDLVTRRPESRASDIFLFDAKTRSGDLVSRSEGGGSANGASSHPAISMAGTVVAFQSDASDLDLRPALCAGRRDINLVADIFVFDCRTRLVRRVSTDPRRGPNRASVRPSTGRRTVIAFSSRHPRDPGDEGEDYDLFVRAASK